MPLYYVNVFNDDVTMDDEGLDFADDQAARAHGVIEARILAADTVSRGQLIGHHWIDIASADQEPVDSIRFDEAVEISD